VYGEHHYQVPPLGVGEAELLFVQRAQAAHAAFVPNEDEARIRLLPPRALLVRLSRGLSVLASSVQNVPERQQTLRRTIDWSYALLDAAEQKVFRCFSVLAGGGTLDIAETVCDLTGSAEDDPVVDSLASLVDKSLVERRDEIDGEPRFAMLETIREYASELLEQSGDAGRIRDAHARAFVGLAEQAAPELAGPLQAHWLARLDAEQENLRAALSWTLDSGPTESGVRLASALFRFWDARGQVAEGQRWLDRALAIWVSNRASAARP